MQLPTLATKSEFEFLVKHRGVAYWHAAWSSALEIEALSVRARTVPVEWAAGWGQSGEHARARARDYRRRRRWRCALNKPACACRVEYIAQLAFNFRESLKTTHCTLADSFKK